MTPTADEWNALGYTIAYCLMWLAIVAGASAVLLAVYEYRKTLRRVRRARAQIDRRRAELVNRIERTQR